MIPGPGCPAPTTQDCCILAPIHRKKQRLQLLWCTFAAMTPLIMALDIIPAPMNPSLGLEAGMVIVWFMERKGRFGFRYKQICANEDNDAACSRGTRIGRRSLGCRKFKSHVHLACCRHRQHLATECAQLNPKAELLQHMPILTHTAYLRIIC